ncbi:MAG: response regulator, partial [Oscillospiraceae bacterium]|nr:response regulator [Oscillospiraceae bacterium]
MSRLLIVDDEEANLQELSEILGSEYELYTASSGVAAIDTAERILPDLILLDILMPEMSGFEAISALKESEATRDIPVVFITGYTNAENMDIGLKYGAVDCIGKPFIPSIIKHRVQNYVQMINHFRELQANKEKNREAEEAQRNSNMLKNILNTIDAMIYVTVPDTGELLFVNENMKRHFNIKNEYIGRFCYQIFQRGLTKRCSFCPCHQLDKEPDTPVVWTERNPLTGRVYRNTDSYIEWPGGKTAHLQYSVDVTELINTKEQAVNANEAKNRFLATMSHEIRTPMNAILGITEIQLHNETLPLTVQEGLVKIHDAGYTLLHIINDMLDLSKIEAGKMNVNPVKYDVPSLINDAVHLNILRLGSKPISFQLEVDEKIPSELYGDELRIKQILNNLLSNAFKYTERGVIALSVMAGLSPNQSEVELILRVSDTGQGMTETQIENLFEEYTQFGIAASQKNEGVGLGMSIVQRLVNMMNGRITVESEPGVG